MDGLKVVGIKKIAPYERDGVTKEGREIYLECSADDVEGVQTSSVYVGNGNEKLFAKACSVGLGDVIVPIRNEHGRVDNLLVLETAKK